MAFCIQTHYTKSYGESRAVPILLVLKTKNLIIFVRPFMLRKTTTLPMTELEEIRGELFIGDRLINDVVL